MKRIMLLRVVLESLAGVKAAGIVSLACFFSQSHLSRRYSPLGSCEANPRLHHTCCRIGS